jgi:hypothetical protein
MKHIAGAIFVRNQHTEIGWFTIEEACSLEALAFAEYRRLFRNLTLST